MSVREFEDLEHTIIYHKYRPHYPTSLIKRIIAYLKEKQPNAALEIDRLKWQTPLITAKDVEGVIAWTPTSPKSQHRDVLTATLSTASKVAEFSGSVTMGILKTAFWLITPGF